MPSTQRALGELRDAHEGCVVCADYQSQGRGQQGTSWESEGGKNLLFSLLLTPAHLPTTHLFDLSRTAALALANYLIDNKIDAKIKWANDIFVGEKKIAGILIEPTVRGDRVLQAIVGVGFNVNQQQFATAPLATSISLIANKLHNKEEILQGILLQFSQWYDMLQNEEYQAIRESYTALLYRKTGLHRYRAEGGEFLAELVKISDSGDLMLQKTTGKTCTFRFKQVEFVH